MPKSIVLGNGTILVGLDRSAEVRDFYFPYVGLENHVGGRYAHKVGVWVDGHLSWLDEPGWEIYVDAGKETLSSNIRASSRSLGVVIDFNDIVYNEKNIFIRKVIVWNRSSRRRIIKLFFHQQFELYESHRGDTAYYDPVRHVVIHYKGRRVFLVNALKEDAADPALSDLRDAFKAKTARRGNFDDFSVGVFGIEGKEGTHRDAEDGVLEKNPIEHGKVDSVIALTLDIEREQSQVVYYWLAVAKSLREARDLNNYVLERTPQHLMKTTQDFWYAWVNKQNFSFYGLDPAVVELFKKSLFVIRAHVDTNGAIIASGDSDMLQYGRDTYGYMWLRDGALSAMALDEAGDGNVAKRFFEFCNAVISEEGYFLHKYLPDKALGSSWHPWVRDGKPELPIQEDQTALVLYALWEHYEISKDLEFIESIYNSLIKKSADFLVSYLDHDTGLPHPSYDLWEEKYGTSTFTAAAVYGAIVAAAKFAKLLGKTDSERMYLESAERLRQGILNYLWNEKEKTFYKMMNAKGGAFIYDATVDMSSVYGVYAFGVLPVDDERVRAAIKTAEEKLRCRTAVGGVARYADDRYYRVSRETPGNPWFITSLWLAQYYVSVARTEKDLDRVKEWLAWTVKHSLSSGILSEQLNPHTGEQISAAPLTWSHSEFIITVIKYLEKLEELGVCIACNPVK